MEKTSDIGEEILTLVKELIARLDKMILMENEKEYQNTLLGRVRI